MDLRNSTKKGDERIMDTTELQNIAITSVKLNSHFAHAAIYNSNCECNDSDGCDGDCGGDCVDSTTR